MKLCLRTTEPKFACFVLNHLSRINNLPFYMAADAIYPEPPSRIGKITPRKYIDGSPMIYEVLDEIVRVVDKPPMPPKAIYLQLLKFADDGRTEMRLCYYIIGQKPRGKGKWLFGQYATMIRREDFEQLIIKAKEKGWIS